MSVSFESTKKLILDVSNAISKAGRTAPANYVVTSRAVADVINGEIKIKKLLGYDVVADPGFGNARMELREEYREKWGKKEPKGQKFNDLDPYGEENWED